MYVPVGHIWKFDLEKYRQRNFVLVGHIWKFDLKEYEIRGFGMKFNFSKIRIETVMLGFLATTKNIKSKIRTTESQLREKDRKNSGKLLFAISEIIIKTRE